MKIFASTITKYVVQINCNYLRFVFFLFKGHLEEIRYMSFEYQST